MALGASPLLTWAQIGPDRRPGIPWDIRLLDVGRRCPLVPGMRFPWALGLGLSGLLLAGCQHGPSADGKAVGPGTPTTVDWELASLDGVAWTMAPRPGDRAVVFEFLGTECPIAGRVQPELERLAQELGPRGVRFVAVYPNPGETASGIRNHRAEAGQTVEAGLDPGQRLADRFGVTVTPEVVVLASDGRLIYQGRVNDQYGAVGKGRPAPTRHDLAEALREFIDTGEPKAVRTTPVGCRIQRLP